jgi:hypothetical protein
MGQCDLTIVKVHTYVLGLARNPRDGSAGHSARQPLRKGDTHIGTPNFNMRETSTFKDRGQTAAGCFDFG